MREQSMWQAMWLKLLSVWRGKVEQYNAKDCLGFDPENPEDCLTTIGEVMSFMNAERAAAGLPKARSLIMIASEKSFTEVCGTDVWI